MHFEFEFEDSPGKRTRKAPIPGLPRALLSRACKARKHDACLVASCSSLGCGHHRRQLQTKSYNSVQGLVLSKKALVVNT